MTHRPQTVHRTEGQSLWRTERTHTVAHPQTPPPPALFPIIIVDNLLKLSCTAIELRDHRGAFDIIPIGGKRNKKKEAERISNNSIALLQSVPVPSKNAANF